MDNKPATIHDVCPLELVNCTCCSVDCRHRVLLGVSSLVCIIRVVPVYLQIDECIREFPDFNWEYFHGLPVAAGTSRLSVFKCAVHLTPRFLALLANEHVGGGAGQRVENRVIRGADRTTQVCLRGPSLIKPCQADSGFYQVVRFQVSRCPVCGRDLHRRFFPAQFQAWDQALSYVRYVQCGNTGSAGSHGGPLA